MKIALISGHSYKSKGACSPHLGICEFEYNDTFIDDIMNHYHGDHELIRIMRGQYQHLPEQTNKEKPDYIISFHCNAYNEFVSGTETLYFHKSIKSRRLAVALQQKMVDVLDLDDRGAKPKTSEDRGGYLLRYTHAPCVIVEPFFIDNYEDLNRAITVNNELRDAFIDFFYEFEL